MAVNLLEAGFKVCGFLRSDAPDFARAGGVRLPTPAAVARASDILLLCLPGEGAQREVLHGVTGVLPALEPGQIVIELSTYTREFKCEQADAIRRHGGRPLEAEVSGSPTMVAAGKAVLFLGGDKQTAKDCRAVLDAIAPNQRHIGGYGDAVDMKLIANYLVTVHTMAAAEAMNLGMRAGFSPERIVEVIGKSAGASAMFGIRAPIMASGKYEPAPGAFVTLEKYLELVTALGRKTGTALPLFEVANRYFRRGLAGDMRQKDIAAVIEFLKEDSESRNRDE